VTIIFIVIITTTIIIIITTTTIIIVIVINFFFTLLNLWLLRSVSTDLHSMMIFVIYKLKCNLWYKTDRLKIKKCRCRRLDLFYLTFLSRLSFQRNIYLDTSLWLTLHQIVFVFVKRIKIILKNTNTQRRHSRWWIFVHCSRV
jgi:hypothetical protein